MSGEPRAAVASVVLVQEAMQRAGAREVVVDQQLVAAPVVVEGPEWHEVVVARGRCGARRRAGGNTGTGPARALAWSGAAAELACVGGGEPPPAEEAGAAQRGHVQAARKHRDTGAARHSHGEVGKKGGGRCGSRR